MNILNKFIFILFFYGCITGLMSLYSTPVYVSGTAFFINENGYLVTAAHVVRNDKSMFVFYHNKTYSANVLYVDKNKDIAFLNILNLHTSYLAFQDTSVKIPIKLYGFPLPDKFGINLKYSPGYAEEEFILFEGRDELKYHARSYGGYSGGPIVNTVNKTVAGVVTIGYNLKFFDKKHGANQGYGPLARYIIEDANKANIKIHLNKSKFDNMNDVVVLIQD